MTFFTSLLSPSLLSLSPLQTIVACLSDTEKIHFCRVNRDHHSILPRMRMNDYHRLAIDDWNRIESRQGPIITSIQLRQLTELNVIPTTQRSAIKRVRFTSFGKDVIPRELIPPLLEVLSSDDNFTHGYNRFGLNSDQLPILPSTLRTLILSWRMMHEGDVGSMMKRILSEAQNLTDLRISGYDPRLFEALPSSIVSLSLHMYNIHLPDSDGWPASLKHLSIETDNECEVELEPIRPPPQLESIKFPGDWRYHHYEETLNLISKLSSLRFIKYGLGISECQSDIFALLPRTVTSVLYNDNMCLDGCDAARVDSLPDSVKVLKFALSNQIVTRWPSKLRVLRILGDQFSQDLSSLPDSVEELRVPSGYVRTVSKWPTQLKKVALSPQFFDIASLERLPAGVTHLTVSIVVARKLMLSGKLPPHLIRLQVLGRSSPLVPFDVRQLPASIQEVVFDGSRAKLIGLEERTMKVSSQYLTHLQEVDLEANAALLSDPRMAQLDEIEDAEESIGFVPKPEYSWEAPKTEPTAAQLASNKLFYTEPEYSGASLTQYEIDFHGPSMFSGVKQPPTPTEVIQRFAIATADSPVNGVSFKDVQTPPLILALTSALAAGKITGPLSLSQCKCDYSRQFYKQTTSGWRDGVAYSEEKPYPDMIGLELMISEDPELMKDEKKQTVKEMTQLLEAMPNSKITRLKIETPGDLFENREAFTTFCASISRMPMLRTIVFRKVGRTRLQLLVRTLLSPECAQIENVDLGDCELKENYEPIVQLIRETKTLKQLVVSHTNLPIAGLSQVAQAIAVNRSLVSINLAGNPSGVAGLNALRLTLRENRSINITACHSDFGAPGIEMLKEKRHARLKESNRHYSDGGVRGWDVELL